LEIKNSTSKNNNNSNNNNNLEKPDEIDLTNSNSDSITATTTATATATTPSGKSEFDKKFEEDMKEQNMKRLNFLLDRTSLYSKFLSDKMKNPTNQEKEQPRKGKKKRKQEENASFKEKLDEEIKSLEDADVSLQSTFPQPKLVTGGEMRPYQLAGLEWLVSLYENGLNGILADEMGLGKTIQCIAFFAYLFEKKVFGPFLVVVPVSTLPNWIREFKMWTPTMTVLKYHGTKEERAQLRADHLSKKKEFPIVVTSYEIAMNDRQYLQKKN